MNLFRKLLTIIIFFICSSVTNTIFSWDTTAAKYYPLAVGNIWSYHKITYSDQYCIIIISETDYIVRVVKDTLLPNGKRYFVLNGSSYFNNGLQRIDSNTMNVYRWSGGTECMTDSLLARKGDYFRSCRLGTNYQSLFSDTSRINFAGQNRKVRLIQGFGSVGESYKLMENMGVYYNGVCEFGGSHETLNGCIINGIQYGTIIGIDETGEQIQIEFKLYQNYPNPFNPTTKIKASLAPSKGGMQYVKLIIYDILGKEVSTLINDKLEAGTYEVEWDATNFASGIYFYTLKTEYYSETKKMLLIK